MKKKLLVAIGGLAVLMLAAGAVLVRVVDVRGWLDGSGVWPRYVTTPPDYEALEADRARQRATMPPLEPPVAPEPPAASSTTPAAAGDGAPAPASAPVPGSAEAARPLRPAREQWADFRGPARDGRYLKPIRTEWPSDGLPLLWKQPIGPGYASFVAAEGRAFTIEQRRQQEVVAAYDIDTGRELWTNAWDGEFVEAMGGDGPRATPTYHDGRVYALGALGEFRCLDARTGSVLWRRNILSDAGASNISWGMAASPLIVDDTVVVLPGGSNGKSVAAYDRRSGEIVWTALDDEAAYTSPMLVEIGGVRQLLIVTAKRVLGLPTGGGQVLWEHPWETFNGINVAQPLLLGGDRILMSAAYDHGALVLAVKRNGEAFTTEVVWENNRLKNKFTSSVLHEGFVYGLDEAILACVDAATGQVKWKGGRYGYGQLLLAGDRLIVLTEGGDVVQVRATPSGHEELARFEAIKGKSWNHPIIVDGRLLVRNVREMAAFDIRPK
jgi:outer membrane protein assembly factor BamB